jgi:hypothetical protein
MTALGKFLVFLTTTGALLLAVMSYSSWVTSYDFTDRPGKDGEPDGTYLKRKQKIEAIQKSGQLSAVSKAYKDSVSQLNDLEKKRAAAEVFYAAELAHAQKGATKTNPVREVVIGKDGVAINPQNLLPMMIPAKNENTLEPGKDRFLQAKVAYAPSFKKLEGEIAEAHKAVNEETKKIVALSNEISNQGGQKGLVTRNAEELEKIALLKVELFAMRGNLINIAADLFMNQKRVKQLNDRMSELGKISEPQPTKP